MEAVEGGAMHELAQEAGTGLSLLLGGGPVLPSELTEPRLL